jgi:hypothetical protein
MIITQRHESIKVMIKTPEAILTSNLKGRKRAMTIIAVVVHSAAAGIPYLF